MMNKKGLIFFLIFLMVLSLGMFLFLDSQKKNGFLAEFKEEVMEIPFEMPAIPEIKFPKRECNIKEYGAVGDGETLNTEAFRKAIEDCSKKGGGKVIIPKGKWLSGAIHLKNNINLYLAENSELIFTANLKDYLPAVFSRFQGIELYNYSPPIYAKDCENIAITGKGKIIGNGEEWKKWSDSSDVTKERDMLYKKAAECIPVSDRIFANETSGLRPSFVQFINCKNIFINGITIGDGPMWTIHPIYSENIKISGIKIDTHSANTDGIVIDSSKNVIIENSVLSTGDDAIAIKSGLEEDGWKINIPSENIVVKNCQFTKGHGAVSIGSEMSGGIRNVFVNKNSLAGIESGFRIKSTMSRGGFIENIWVKDLNVIQAIKEVIIFNLVYNSKLEKNELHNPYIKNIYINNVKADNSNQALRIESFTGSHIENVIIENLNVKEKKSSYIDNASGIVFRNIDIQKENDKVKSKEKDYSIKINDSQNILLEKFICRNNKSFCVKISGHKTKNLDLSSSTLNPNQISVSADVNENEVIKPTSN